jgi:hypothetical protein
VPPFDGEHMTAATTQRWVCPACRHANPVEADLCDGCGVSFISLLRGAPTTSPADVPAVHLTPPALGKVVTAVREIGIVLGLILLWKLASAISLGDTAAAFGRGSRILQLEQTLRLPSELRVQSGLLAHPDLVRVVNLFYLVAHIGSLAIFLPWMFIRHRPQYRRWRNIIAVFTGVSLLIQLVSVAPPRLLPQFGFVDTAARYHESAYTHLGQGLTGQLSSMPSIHVGWAIAIAMAVISTSTSRWRWLVLAQPILTTYAVVATANHFWLDCVAAAGLVLIVFAAINWWGRRQLAFGDESAGSERA